MGKPKADIEADDEDSKTSEVKEIKVILESVVKTPAKGFLGRQPTRNLILTNEPRLYLTTTLAYDKVEGAYKKDILLFVQLAVKQKKRDEFEIHCPFTKKTFTFITADAENWVKTIKNVLLSKRVDEDQQDEQYLR